MIGISPALKTTSVASLKLSVGPRYAPLNGVSCRTNKLTLKLFKSNATNAFTFVKNIEPNILVTRNTLLFGTAGNLTAQRFTTSHVGLPVCEIDVATTFTGNGTLATVTLLIGFLEQTLGPDWTADLLR